MCAPLKGFCLYLQWNDLCFLSYFRLILSVLLFYPNSILLLIFVGFLNTMMYTFLSIVLIADLVLNLLFVAVVYRKNVKLLKICFYYTMATTVLFTLFLVLLMAYVLYKRLYIIPAQKDIYVVVLEILSICVTGFAYFSLQTYGFLLLGNEIKMLGEINFPSFTSNDDKEENEHNNEKLPELDINNKLISN